jgi:thymidylate synthase (FAD)
MIKVELVDFMGDDVRVAEAARVSFDRSADAGAGSTERQVALQHGTKSVRDAGDRDAKLVKYLARHNHWTPSAHVVATIVVTAPIFVARQLAKHTVGLVMNEVSRRYVDTPPEFYEFDTLRARPVDKKQGSHPDHVVDASAKTHVEAAYAACRAAYDALIQAGVAPEQARAVLPQATMTSWYWTGSLAAFARVCKLRLAADAQQETRLVAELIDQKMHAIAPVAWREADLVGVRDRDGDRDT